MDRNKIFIIVALVAIISTVQPMIKKMMDPTVYKGPWYTVHYPEGWEKKKDGDEIVFISPDEDVFTDMPQAMFSIYTKKITGAALFLDDMFADTLEQLSRMDGRIIDRGEVKIDEEVSKWVLFNNKEPELVILSFYMIDDFNRLTKIQYAAPTKYFRSHREKFEEFKDSFTFKKMF